MGKIFKNMKIAKQAFAKRVELQAWADEACRTDGSIKEGLPIDHRDLMNIVMVYNMGNNNFKTKEEVVTALHEVSNLLRTNKEKVLDKIYDVYEDFDYTSPKTSTFQDCLDSLSVYEINQGFATIMVHNPDYLEKRYMSSVKKERAYDAASLHSLNMTTEWAKEFIPEGISIGTMGYLEEEQKNAMMGAYVNLSEYDSEMNDFSLNLRSEICKAFTGKKDMPEIELPYAFAKLEEIAHAEDEAERTHKRYKGPNANDFFQKFTETFTPSESCTGRVTCKVLGSSYGEDNIYVDGKKITEGVPKGDSHNSYHRHLAVKLIQAIKEGKCVEVANSYEVNGELHHTMTPVKFSLSEDLKTEYENQYDKENHIGFIHKTFFNWGPWKIPYPDMTAQFNKNLLTESVADRMSRENEILHDMEKNLNPLYNEKKIRLQMDEARRHNPKPLKDDIRRQVEIEDDKSLDEQKDDSLEEDVKDDVIIENDEKEEEIPVNEK